MEIVLSFTRFTYDFELFTIFTIHEQLLWARLSPDFESILRTKWSFHTHFEHTLVYISSLEFLNSSKFELSIKFERTLTHNKRTGFEIRAKGFEFELETLALFGTVHEHSLELFTMHLNICKLYSNSQIRIANVFKLNLYSQTVS